MSGQQVYSTFEDSQERQEFMCAGLGVLVWHVTGKCTQTHLLLLSFQTLLLLLSRPSGPLLASESSTNTVNILGVRTVILSLKGSGGCLHRTGLSVFDARSAGQITSAQREPKANISVNFSIPDLSTRFIPFQLGSVPFCSDAHRRLKREGNLRGRARLQLPSCSDRGGGGGGCGSGSWGSSAAVWPALFSP